MLILVRVRPRASVLLACLLAWSGICLCLGGGLELTAAQASHCGTEPAAPQDHEGAACEPGCSAVPALQLRGESQSGEAFPGSLQPASVDVLSRPVPDSARPQSDTGSLATHEPRDPLYIWHSALLI